jgi:EF hand
VFLYERDRYIYNDLARRTGSIIFSASHAGEMSFESPKIQNGFFTHEILEALASSQADTNQDGKISMDELEAFVSLKVALMTGGLQRPAVERDNAYSGDVNKGFQRDVNSRSGDVNKNRSRRWGCNHA